MNGRKALLFTGTPIAEYCRRHILKMEERAENLPANIFNEKSDDEICEMVMTDSTLESPRLLED